MTTEKLKNNSIARFFESVRWLYRPLVLTLLTAGFGWAYVNGTKLIVAIDTTTFSTPTDKVLMEEFLHRLNKSGSTESMWFDHVTSKDEHMPRKIKDSVYPTRDEFDEILKEQAKNFWYVQQGIRKNAESDAKIMNIQQQVLDKLDDLDDRMNRNGY